MSIMIITNVSVLHLEVNSGTKVFLRVQIDRGTHSVFTQLAPGCGEGSFHGIKQPGEADPLTSIYSID